MPVDLGISGFDPADNDLHSLAGERVELLRQLENLVGFHLLLLSYVNEPNRNPEKQAVAFFRDGQDLHPAKQNKVALQTV